MVKKLFFTGLVIMTAMYAVMLGNDANTVWQTANDPVAIGLAGSAFLAGLLVVSGNSKYHRSECSEYVGYLVLISAVAGAYFYGLISGPLNNGAWGWFNGWLIALLFGLIPTMNETYDAIANYKKK